MRSILPKPTTPVIVDEWLEADPEEPSTPEAPKGMPPLPATATLTRSEFPPGAVVTLSKSTAPPPDSITLSASEFPPAALVTVSTSEPPPPVVATPAPLVEKPAGPPPLPAPAAVPETKAASDALVQPTPTVTEAIIDVPLPPAPLVPSDLSVEAGPPQRTSRSRLFLALGALFVGGFGLAAVLWSRSPDTDLSATAKNIAPREEPRLRAVVTPDPAAPIAPTPPAPSTPAPSASATAERPEPAPSAKAAPSVEPPAEPPPAPAPPPVEKKAVEAPSEVVAPQKASAPAAATKAPAEAVPETDLSGLEPAKPAKTVARVDDDALQQALSEAAARARGCRDATSPTGVATVSVTIASSGDATGATVTNPPFAHTLEGECIAAKFRAVHVPAFKGDTINVRKSVTLQ
jgi:hypothetical protein